jgi:two-component system, chemotaxis family, chemotaxis protein CheY
MNPNRARLLVVDDTRMIRRVVRDLMRELGFTNIDEAADGAAALELFRSTHFDLVLTDWNMPRLTGIELLSAIRTGEVRPHTPVVIFTGEVSARRMLQAVQSGANGFIEKPFVAEALCEKVFRIVAALPPKSEFMPMPLIIPESLRALL